MSLADVLCLVVAVASLGIASFVVVNHARIVSPLLKAAGQFNEAVANFALMQERHVEARIATYNAKVPIARDPFIPERPIPQTGEPPLPGDEPNLIDDAHEADYEMRESAAHPSDRYRRDVFDNGPVTTRR